MIVYQTDQTGIFVGTTTADESPLQPGVFLIPAGCVTDPPPALAANELARFVDGAWLVEPIPEPEPEPEPPPPVEPPPPTKLFKATIWRRATDAEAEAMRFALSQAPVRLQEIFAAAQYLDTTDDDFPALRAGIAAALGEPRADELLAPEF